MKRRLLVVAYHAPPSTAVGGLRWWGLTKYLARIGWDVTILTRADESGSVANESVRVLRIPRRLTLQDRYQHWRGSAEAARPASTGDASARASSPSNGGWMRRVVAIGLGFPDDARGWLWRAYRRGAECVDTHTPDVIISTGPPHSVHVLARLLSDRCGARHVMDYRDPWTAPIHDAVQAGPLLEGIERRLFASADAVFATTPELVTQLRRAVAARKVIWVPNGVDTEMLPHRALPVGRPPEFVHVGSVYLRRDPTGLLAGFRTYLSELRRGTDPGVLRFVGVVEEPFRSTLLLAAEEPLLKGRISIEEPVPRAVALQAVAGSNLALVLATRQEALVPAKLYESVAMGVPTLVITEAGSASDAAASRVGAYSSTPADVAGIARAFADAAAGNFPAAAGENAPMTHHSIAALVSDYLDEIVRERIDPR